MYQLSRLTDRPNERPPDLPIDPPTDRPTDRPEIHILNVKKSFISKNLRADTQQTQDAE